MHSTCAHSGAAVHAGEIMHAWIPCVKLALRQSKGWVAEVGYGYLAALRSALCCPEQETGEETQHLQERAS